LGYMTPLEVGYTYAFQARAYRSLTLVVSEVYVRHEDATKTKARVMPTTTKGQIESDGCIVH